MTPPIKNYKHRDYPNGSVTQWFGENPQLYGPRMGLAGHNGIDIVASWGTPIYAVEGGLVLDVKNSPDGYGKHIRIFNKESGSEWTYAHNSENFVEIGEVVEEGQHIANMGNTGFVVSGSTPFWKHNPYAGTHLHLGRREIHLAKASEDGWRYNNMTPRLAVDNYDNGFKGAVNFADMLRKEEPETDEEKIDAIKGMTPVVKEILLLLIKLGLYKI